MNLRGIYDTHWWRDLAPTFTFSTAMLQDPASLAKEIALNRNELISILDQFASLLRKVGCYEAYEVCDQRVDQFSRPAVNMFNELTAFTLTIKKMITAHVDSEVPASPLGKTAVSNSSGGNPSVKSIDSMMKWMLYLVDSGIWKDAAVVVGPLAKLVAANSDGGVRVAWNELDDNQRIIIRQLEDDGKTNEVASRVNNMCDRLEAPT